MYQKRFYLAEEAPICQRELLGEFGYNGVLPSANAVLETRYEYPIRTDEVTKEIFKEVARIEALQNEIPGGS